MPVIFPPALVAAIRDARLPQAADVQQLAAKMWCEGYPARAQRNWHELDGGSVEHRRMVRAAEIALGGHRELPLPLAA